MKPNPKTPNEHPGGEVLNLPLLLPDEYAKATDIRLRLLEQGYRPLPTAEKVAFQKGWPTMPVTPDIVRSWPMMAPGLKPAVTTAIQLEGTMLAIDVDVSDQEVADEVEDLLYDELGQERFKDAPYRHSQGAKFMILLRTDEPYKMWKTSKYLDADGQDHMVEAYGGGSTRYFSCFSVHTFGGTIPGDGPGKARYEVLKKYVWADGPTPLDTRPEDLPLVTVEEVDRLLMRIGDRFEELERAGHHGWQRVKSTRQGAFEGGVAYDLTEEMTFETKSGVLTYYEALAYAMDERDARCSSSFLDGESRNTGKCRMAVVGSVADDDLALSVFDHETWVMHYPATWAPRSTEERQELATSLGRRLRELDLSDYEEEEPVSDEFRAEVEHLMDNYVFCEKSNAYHRFGGDPFSRILGAAIKQTYDLRLEYRHKAGNGQTYDKVTTAGAVFMAQEGKMKAWFPEYDPRQEPGTLFFSDFTGHVVMNAWNGLPDLGEADPHWVDLIENRFLPHLIPSDRERDFVLDWLATKYARPWERMSAILFLAENVSGTGRGTLFEILDGVFGTNAQLLSEHQLFNDQFNAWAVSNVLILCNELGKSSRWQSKEETYGRLKELVDPTNTQVSVRHMGVASAKALTFTSFIMATNRGDGLRLDYEDRRTAVITNGGKLTGAEAWADELMDEKRDHGVKKLAAAMAAILRDRDIKTAASELATPPKFSGWHTMIEKASGSIDRVLREIGETYQGRATIWTKKAFKDLVWDQAKDELPRGANKTTVMQEIEKLVGEKAEQLGLYLLKAKVKVGIGTIEIVTNLGGAENLPSAVEDREAILVEGGALTKMHALAAALGGRGETS